MTDSRTQGFLAAILLSIGTGILASLLILKYFGSLPWLAKFIILVLGLSSVPVLFAGLTFCVLYKIDTRRAVTALRSFLFDPA